MLASTPTSEKPETQLPAWKQALIERRRLQEALEARQHEEEQAQLAQLPAWKREILLKKHGKTGSGSMPNGILKHRDEVAAPLVDDLRRRSTEKPAPDIPPSIANDLDLSSATDAEERLLPLNQNPIFRRDLERRRSLKPLVHRIVIDPKPRSSRPKNDPKDAEDRRNSTVNGGSNELKVGEEAEVLRLESSSSTDDARTQQEQEDEMVYGHGFVSKLRDKFRQLIENPPATRLEGRCRSHSTDDLLDDDDSSYSVSTQHQRPITSQTTTSFGAKCRTFSIENLVSESKSLKSVCSTKTADNVLYPVDKHRVNGTGLYKSNVNNNSTVRHSFSEPNFQQNFDQKYPNKKADFVSPADNSLVPSIPSNDDGGELKLHGVPSTPVPEEDELPKPNTVNSVRTLFEKGGSGRVPVPLPDITNTAVTKPNQRQSTTADSSTSLPIASAEPKFNSQIHEELGDNNPESSLASLPIRIAPKKISASDVLKDRNRSRDVPGPTLTGRIEDHRNGNLGGNTVENAHTTDRLLKNTPTAAAVGDLNNVSKPNVAMAAGNEPTKPDRKNLNLNLAELSQPKSSRKIAAVVTGPSNGLDRNHQASGLDFTSEDATDSSGMPQHSMTFGEEYDSNGISFSDPYDYDSFYDDNVTDDDDLSDYDEDPPREGDPTIYRRRSVRPVYEFEGAGVIVERSLLAKSKNGKQRKLAFDDDAISTHEYPSERLLELMFHEEQTDDAAGDGGRLRYDVNAVQGSMSGPDEPDSSISSYKSRSVVNHYVMGQSRDVTQGSGGGRQQQVAPPSDDDAVIQLRPVDSESVTWSKEATSDLLF